MSSPDQQLRARDGALLPTRMTTGLVLRISRALKRAHEEGIL